MPNVPQRRKLTKALKELLELEVGVPVGVAAAPRNNDGEQADLPYIVIYPIASGFFSGPAFCGPNADVKFEFQINSEGIRDDQAEWLADLVRVTLIDRDQHGTLVNRIQYPDHSVMDQEIVGPPGKLDQVGQIWSVKESYAFSVTSSS